MVTMVSTKKQWYPMTQSERTSPRERLTMSCKYSIIYLCPESATRTHLLFRFLASALFFWRGARSLRMQTETQFMRTIRTDKIAEKPLKARFLTAISA